MKLNTLKPAKGSKHFFKRVGRGIGSGLGKTCGRGHKGQKSRSGCYLRRAFEGGQMPLYRRLPKFGFISRRSHLTQEIYLSDLEKIKNNIITINALKMANIIGQKIQSVKIINSGHLSKSVTVQGLRITKGARTMIEAVGGTIQ